MRTKHYDGTGLELCLSRQNRQSYPLTGILVAVALLSASAQGASPQPPRLSISSPAGSEDYRLVIEGEQDRDYVLEASTDLASWVSISTNRTGGGGTVQVTDPRAERSNPCFYRALLQGAIRLQSAPPTETVWIDDAVPAGAVTGAGGGDDPQWQWVTNNPTPFSGTRAHQSSLTSGSHYHYFVGATATLNVQTGDVLFAYVYLDPAHVPGAILLEWYDGSNWEHRAYWGANRFGYGTDGTASRRSMGPLPAAGQWVRLEVPASLVGLEGQTLSGMVFELWDGQATWDYSGKSISSNPPPSLPTVTVTASDDAAAEAGPDYGRFTFTRTGDTTSSLTVNYALGGTAQNGTDYQRLETSVTIPAGSSSAAVTVTPIDDTAAEGNETVVLTLFGDAAYQVGSPGGSASVTIADNEQSTSTETVWVDDAVPAGATTGAGGDDDPQWNWVTNNPAPFSGTRAHQSSLASGEHYHYFAGASPPFTVQTGDVLFAHIYLDPDHVPSTIMLQWYDGNTWDHRAYWGANRIGYGTDGTASRRFMGPLPSAGQWVRLEVPASLVGLEGQTLSGMVFDLFDGQATWDYSGKSTASNSPPLPPPTVTVTASDDAAAEAGPDSGTFTFTRTGDTTSPLTVNYTLAGTAQNGTDYQQLETSVTIPAGSSSAAVTVMPIDDSTVETNETVILTLSTNAAYTVGSPDRATVTIADNDQPPPPPPPLPTVTVTADDDAATEAGPDSGAFTFMRTGDTTSALTVNYTLGGTAQNRTDYQQLETSVTIPAGSSSAAVTVTPIDDSTVETNETVILTLSTNAAYTVGSPDRATVIIADNDQPPPPPPRPTVTVVASVPLAAELGLVDGKFTISRSDGTGSALTVRFTLGGTATNGSDYQQMGTTLTIPEGATSVTLRVRPIQDTRVELAETVVLTLAEGPGYTIGLWGTATVTIADDDLLLFP